MVIIKILESRAVDCSLCVCACKHAESLDESFKSTLPLQNLHHSNLHYRTSLPNKTLMGNVAWNSREIYSAKKPLHGCTPFSILVMTQTSVLMLWVEDLYMADRGGKKKEKTDHLEHFCMVRNTKTHVHCGGEQQDEWKRLRSLRRTSPRCHDLLTFPMDKTKVLLQPPPLWITSPSRCVHKTQYTKQRVAEKSTPTPLCLWYNAD